jgi:patatin-like phospholipase/acyl hydrolase
MGKVFKILSIDGGGIKGLYSASILSKFEKTFNCQTSDHFDMICGTSTGGLIALALSLKIPAKDICEFYENKGELIFKNKGTYKKYESYIEFNEFLLNLNDLKSGVKYKSDDLTNASLNLETSYLSDVKLFVDYDLDYYYLKIK